MLRSRLATFVYGFVAGTGLMLFAFPFLFPPAVASDPPPRPVAAVASTSGAAAIDAAAIGAGPGFAFDEHAPGRDPLHWANGTGRFERTAEGWVLRLEGDFRAGPGPDFWIYLNTRSVGDERDFRADQGRVKLTRLRSFSGAQNYLLPPGLEPAAFHTVTIWCERFGMYIGSGAFADAAREPARA
jgi:hypothetical protein